MMVEEILHQHENMIDKHEDKLENIQANLTDIKVRLGIKDKTNGQVVKYQEDLVAKQDLEREERKEQDAHIISLMEKMDSRIDKVDERMWYLATGVLLSIILEIGLAILSGVI